MKRSFITGVIIALLAAMAVTAGPAAGRTAATVRHVSQISVGNSGWNKQFQTIRAAHPCSFNGRYALCKTVRVYVHRYGYVNHGLIYDSGQTLHIVWRDFRGHSRYCLACLLQVRATNFVRTLPYDVTWDWDTMIIGSGWGPCSVREHRYGYGCKVTYREHTNRFVNHYVINPIPLTRTETAGVTTKVWISLRLDPHKPPYGLRIKSTPHCC